MSADFSWINIVAVHNDSQITRNLEFDYGHDSSQVSNILDSMGRNGWTILEVAVDSDYGNEPVDITNWDVLSAFAAALIENVNDAGQMIAYGELYGWDEPAYFTNSRHGYGYEEGFQGAYDSEEDFARGFAEETGEDIPSWVVVDWERTTNELMYDHDAWELFGEVYIFAKH